MTNPLARRTGLLLLLTLAMGWSTAQAQATDGPAAALRDKLQALAPQLQNNAFRRPVSLASTEASDKLSGDVYALLDQPFSRVNASLREPAAWCQVLMLHLNTKNCVVKADGGTTHLSVAVGRKFDQPLSDAQAIDFIYNPGKADANYLDARLSADSGPLSTRDYNIVLEATPAADSAKTAIHLRYAYAYGTAARIAMKGYLATVGSDKVGFTPDGRGGYIGGVRAVVERNTMRYYLAIASYVNAPAAGQLDQRLGAWFDATEQYPKQLHEIERADYLAMKRHEFQRMAKGGES